MRGLYEISPNIAQFPRASHRRDPLIRPLRGHLLPRGEKDLDLTIRNDPAISSPMLHRALQDPIPPADTDADTAAMADTERDIERGERHLRMLAELAEIGMRVARLLGEVVEARIETETKPDGAPARSEDAAAALDKMAQTVRRTAGPGGQTRRGREGPPRRADHRTRRTPRGEQGRSRNRSMVTPSSKACTTPGPRPAPMRNTTNRHRRTVCWTTPGSTSTTPTKCAATSIARSARRWSASAPPWASIPKPASPTAKPGASAAHRWISNCGWKNEPASILPLPKWGGTDREAIRVGKCSMKSHAAVESAILPHPDGAAVCPSP